MRQSLCFFLAPSSRSKSSRPVVDHKTSLPKLIFGLIGAGVLAFPEIASGQASAQSAAQDSSSDSPAFDLIFLDEPTDATPVALTIPSEIEAQRPDSVQIMLRAQSAFVTAAPQADNTRAHDVGALTLRELPPADPLARLASLMPPKAADTLTPDPRTRIVGTDITPLPDEDRIEDDLTEMNPEDLARELQTELARVGCYRLRVDGQWGPGSRRALANYLTRTDQSADGQDPTPEVIRMVRASETEVCPAPVARAAPATRATPARPAAPQPAAPPRQAAPAPAPAPSAPSSGGSRLGSGIMSGLR